MASLAVVKPNVQADEHIQPKSGVSPRSRHLFKLPRQVAAICYRRKHSKIQFLLVSTRGGKWTFPKGSLEDGVNESHMAAREAYEEAGAIGFIEPRHFHTYLHSKGVFWKKGGVQEFLVRAYLLEVRVQHPPLEALREPTWVDAAEAKRLLAHNRERKYADELTVLVDRALARIADTRNGNGR